MTHIGARLPSLSNTLLKRHRCEKGESIHMLVVHDNVTECLEEASLQRLGKEIGNHLKSGAVPDRDAFRLDPILDPEVSDCYVT